jgi:hypothetical protein
MSWKYEPKKRGRQSAEEVAEQMSKPHKFIRVYEDELTTETWKFDLDKFANGPIEVDIKYKAGAEKLLKQMAKEAKQEKKIAKQMKKINEKNAKKN